jgi:hypothetical protein
MRAKRQDQAATRGQELVVDESFSRLKGALAGQAVHLEGRQFLATALEVRFVELLEVPPPDQEGALIR